MKISCQSIDWNIPVGTLARTPRFALAILLGLAAPSVALAANGPDTWNPSGTTANWGGTGANGNWTGANTPPVSGDGLIFGADNSVGSGLGDVLTDNLTIGGTNVWTFTNISFIPGAPAYTITPGIAAGQGPGAGFTLGTPTAATVISQSSGAAQTINDVITLAPANQTISLASGNLQLAGLISGTGGLVLNANGETGILTLTNASSTGEAYTGPTIVGGGQLNLGPFPNTGTNGLGHSSSLMISNGATVVTYANNGLAGSSVAVGSLPVTINAGGILTSQGTTDSSHIRGLLTLNGGTLADGGTGVQPAFGTWDLDDGVVVGGTSTSVISAPDVIPDQSGGTIFNIAVTGGSPDLDVQGTLINGTSTHDTGIIKQGNGLMQLDGVNTYAGPTTISAGTLTINSSAQLGGAAGAYGGLITNNGTLNYNSTGAQTLAGVIKGAGVLNINAGTVTLTAANTYSGATTVASGASLIVASGGASLSAITMNGGSTFIENVATLGGQWSLTNNLTFVDGSPALVINFSNTLSTTTAPLNINGNLNFASTLSLVLNGNALIPTGTYPLITWTGASLGTPPTSANANVTINLTGITATVVQSGKAIDLVVSSGTAPLTWNTGSGLWSTAAANWQGGTLYKDGDAVTFPDTSASSPITVTLNSVVAPSSVTFTNSAKNYVLSGTGGIVGPGGLSLSGSGRLSLSTTNNFSGPTTINNGGTLVLDFTGGATTNLISGSSALVLGNATVNLLGNASITNDQPFAGTTVQSGPNVINASGPTIPELDLGALTDSTGAHLVLYGPATITNVDGVTITPATATITTTTAGAATSAAQEGFLQAGANNTVGAAGYVTVGLYDWASTYLTNGTAGNAPYTIVGGSTVAGFYTPFSNTGNTNANGTQANGAVPAFGPPAGISVQQVNWDITNNTYVAGYSSTRLVMGSMRFNAPLPINVWFGYGQGTGNGNPNNLGGILVTPNVGSNNIILDDHQKGGLNNSTGAPRTIVWQNNTLGELIFDQSLGGNGPPTFAGQFIQGSGYEQNGPGTVSFLGINGYSVGTFLNGGVLEIAQEVCLGGIALGAAQGATNSAVYLNGGTLLANFTGNLDDGISTAVNEHPLAIGAKGGGVAATAGNTFTVDGLITNISAVAGPLIVGIPASSANGNAAGLVPGTGSGTANPTAVNATGTVIFNNLGNTYTGGTIIDSGTLQLTTNNLAVFGAGGITLNGGTFQWLNGITTDISTKPVSLIGNGTLDVNSGAGAANTVTLAHGIGGGGALTVASSTPGGELILAGANSYPGGTTVNANSTLLVNGSVSSGSVTNNGILGGTGTIGGNVVWSPGATALLAAGTPLAVSGAVTLNGNLVTVTGSSLTPAGSPYTLLTAAGGFTAGSTVNGSPGGNAVAAGNLGVVSISGNSLILTVTALPSASWTDGDNSGNWSDPLNWSATFGSTPPSGAQATAIFGTGASPVNLNVNETVGTIGFTSATIPYTISGSHILTLDADGHGAAITMTTGVANAVIAAPISLNDSLTASVGSGDTLTLSNSIGSTSGSKTITLNGAGTTVLSGANSYGPAAGTVGTALSGGGTLQVGNNSALGAGDLSASGASTLQAGAAVTLANRITLGAGATTVNNNGNNLTLNGIISGLGNLTKTGNHTLTLGGANTYSGGTTVNGGFVGISSDGVSGGSAGNLGTVPNSIVPADVTLNSGGLLDTATLTLHPNRGITLTGTGLLDAASGVNFAVAGIIAGNNGINVNSGAGDTGVVDLLAANTFNGVATVSGGALQLGNALALQNAILDLNGGSLDFTSLTTATMGGLSGLQNLNLTNNTGAAVALNLGNNNVTASYSGFLGGGGSVDKFGSGTMTIGTGSSGGANFTGGVRVDNGTLVLGGVGSMNSTNNLDVSGTGAGNLIVANNAVAAFGGTIFLGDGNSAPLAVTLTVMNNASLSAASLNFGDDLARVAPGTSVTVQDNASLAVPGSFDLCDAFSTAVDTNLVNLNGRSTVTVGNFLATTGSTAHQSIINFNGGTLVAATNDPAGSTFLPALTGLTVNVTNSTVPAYISSSNFNITIAASLTGGGDAGLVKLGPGTLTLSGANTYTGLTTVSNGSLYVSGALNSSAENFLVNDGKAFGALYNGTTPQIGTLTLGNGGGATLIFTNVTSTSAALLHADFLYLNGSSTIQIADAVNLTATNEYPLLQLGGLVVTNSGAGFRLSLPGGVSGTLTNDTGIIPGYATLALVVTSVVPYTPPSTISGIVLSGGNLVINATGGTPGATVNVLTSTNLTLPLAQWTTNSSTTFDGNGNLVNYNITGVVNSTPHQYFRLEQ